MARAKKSTFANWQENYSGLILGAIIVVILGLLVANFITRRSEDINGDGEQVTQEMQEQLNAQKPQEYTIAENDSLSKIAEKYYGNVNAWPVLVSENNITNPNVIHVGSKINVPDKATAEATLANITATSYKVAAGDTLFTIAEKVYGDGSRWQTIANANRVGRLPNGNPLIFADSTLVIPR